MCPVPVAIQSGTDLAFKVDDQMGVLEVALGVAVTKEVQALAICPE